MKVGVLGGGQLGLMLGEAAEKLKITCIFLDPADAPPTAKVGEVLHAQYSDAKALKLLAKKSDVITYEFENVPVDALQILSGTDVYPPAHALEVAQDRLMEKTLFQKLGIPTAPFANIENEDDLRQAIRSIRLPAVLKTRRMGYDGKGQTVLKADDDAVQAWKTLGAQPLIFEGFVEFTRELSIIAVRGKNGEEAFYPLTENTHKDGILRVSIAPAPRAEKLQIEAESIARKILGELDYVGVLAIELFEENGQLLANEMAPRVHNSGHWTIEGAQTSQFENHLRAICGLPLGSTAAKGFSVMVNIIGDMPDLSALKIKEGVYLHDYEKAPRKGRKLGHVTASVESEKDRNTLLAEVQTYIS